MKRIIANITFSQLFNRLKLLIDGTLQQIPNIFHCAAARLFLRAGHGVLKPGEDVLETARTLVEDLRLAGQK